MLPKRKCSDCEQEFDFKELRLFYNTRDCESIRWLYFCKECFKKFEKVSPSNNTLEKYEQEK